MNANAQLYIRVQKEINALKAIQRKRKQLKTIKHPLKQFKADKQNNIESFVLSEFMEVDQTSELTDGELLKSHGYNY